MTGNRKFIKPAIYAGLLIVIALLPWLVQSSYYHHIFILTFIYIIATISLRIITTSGQFPLAHAAFMGIGAYVSAVPARWFGWPIWLTIPMGALSAMVIGIVIAYPFARLRAVYYAMVSLFFGMGVLQILFVLQKWTYAYGGLAGIPSLFGASKIPNYYFFLGLALVCLFALHRFEFCRIGTTMKAIAQSYLVASSVGINEARYRVIAVGVGCFFVGLAGATYAHYNMVLSYTSFDILATLWLILYVIVGGIGNFAGPIIGTSILMIVPELFRELKEFVPYLSAGILLIMVYVMPEGLVSLPQVFKSWIAKRRERKVYA